MPIKYGRGGPTVACLVIFGALVLAVGSSDAATAPPGERWKITSSMEMMGMKMPGRTMFMCLEPGQDELPIAQEKNCTTHDVKRTANSVSFRMTCTGKEAVEAQGEVTQLGPNRSRTSMHMKMAEGEMTMTSENEKLGACTGDEMNLAIKRTVDKAQADGRKAQAQAEQQRAQQCADGARKGDIYTVNSDFCRNDKAAVQTYCSNFRAHEGFRKAAEEEARNARSGMNVAGMHPLADSAKLCGVNAEQTREQLCGTAEQQGQYAFIATQCPALATRLAKAHCSGRQGSYQTSEPKYLPVCAALSGQAAEASGSTGSTDAPAPVEAKPEKKPGLLNKGKKALGGLLGN